MPAGNVITLIPAADVLDAYESAVNVLEPPKKGAALIALLVKFTVPKVNPGV